MFPPKNLGILVQDNAKNSLLKTPPNYCSFESYHRPSDKILITIAARHMLESLGDFRGMGHEKKDIVSLLMSLLARNLSITIVKTIDFGKILQHQSYHFLDLVRSQHTHPFLLPLVGSRQRASQFISHLYIVTKAKLPFQHQNITKYNKTTLISPPHENPEV